ncbi:hypothetical protein [uncultured Proteiniphilum sp.]|uniref:tetratricopeptide repeat protein n=1 Tax=uncultured Proteiniphilum sp. TaxID=497637 RepID=UPI00262C5E36|nr:hypothetical protein [uncultured Proteiniphilum sp.]
MFNYLAGAILIIVVMTGCNSRQSGFSALLEDAERLMESRPDSALILIDFLFYPEERLSREQCMRYIVTRAQARHENHRALTSDTLIFEAARYFFRNDKSPCQSALAHLYSGCTCFEWKYYERAMLYFQKAEEYALKTDITALNGLVQYNMGLLHASQGSYSEAIDNYKAAARFYDDLSEKQAYCYIVIGKMYMLRQLSDSVSLYFQKGLEVAGAMGDQNLECMLAQDISEAYSENKQYDKAEAFLRKSFLLNTDSTKLAFYYLNFVTLYGLLQENDSVQKYTRKLKENLDFSNDNHVIVSAYSHLADFSKSLGNFEEALFYREELEETFMRDREEVEKQLVYEIQKKNDYTRFQNMYNTRFVRFQQWLLMLITVLFFVAVAFLFVLGGMLREKNTKLKMMRNMDILRKTTNDLLESDVDNRQKVITMQEMLQWKFTAMKETIQLKYHMPEKVREENQPILDKFDKIVFDRNTEAPLSEFLSVVESLYPGLQCFIRERYPHLSKKEYSVCLLCFAGLSVGEISFLLNDNENSVYKARSGINRKIGHNFCSVLREEFEQNNDKSNVR